MKRAKRKFKRKASKPRRVVLGVGFPCISNCVVWVNNGPGLSNPKRIQVRLKNQDRIRLVAEVLSGD